MPASSHLFFFYSYGAHRDLHSFPTRRSSDLIPLLSPSPSPSSPVSGSVSVSIVRSLPIAALFHSASVPEAEADRKSTRLNSSHVEISYAVFCLKKKKKKVTIIIRMNLKSRDI